MSQNLPTPRPKCETCGRKVTVRNYGSHGGDLSGRVFYYCRKCHQAFLDNFKGRKS